MHPSKKAAMVHAQERNKMKLRTQDRLLVPVNPLADEGDFSTAEAAAYLRPKRKYDDDEMEAAEGLILLSKGGLTPNDRDEMMEAAKTLLELSRCSPPARKKMKLILRLPSAPSRTSGPSPTAPAPPTNSPASGEVILRVPKMKRSDRIVDESRPADALLIAGGVKAGSDIYDSDAEDLPGKVNLPGENADLFRNVRWGAAAFDESNAADFPTEPEFDNFVVGRWEKMPDGTIRDQKRKLLVKMTDREGRRVIQKNHPPKDWSSQKAISALNKRITQWIRRSSSVRFRDRVVPYADEERAWISSHQVDGKPPAGWPAFVRGFNETFAGKVLGDGGDARPSRSQSSLNKEVVRFGGFYKAGKVPITKGGNKKA